MMECYQGTFYCKKKENSLFSFRLKNGHTYRICYENHQQEGGCLEVSTNTIFPLSVKKTEKFFSLYFRHLHANYTALNECFN